MPATIYGIYFGTEIHSITHGDDVLPWHIGFVGDNTNKGGIPRVANPQQHEKKKKKASKVLTRFCQ